MRVAFDVDDTLIIPRIVTGLSCETPNYEVIAIYKWFQSQGNEMIIWSGGGIDYAQMWGEKLGLTPFKVLQKEKNILIDICFDDCIVDLAKVNVRVKRIENRISREEWNKHKNETNL